MSSPPAADPRAGLAVWDPSGSEVLAGVVREQRRLRRVHVLRSAVAAGVAALVWRQVAAWPGVALFVLAVGACVFGLIRPRLAQRAVETTAAGVERVTSWLVLAPVFFGLLAPFGLLRRRGRRDPLRRFIDRGAETYWIERGPDRGPSARERPF